MTPLIERLRTTAERTTQPVGERNAALMMEAASELECLQSRYDRLREIVHDLDGQCPCSDETCACCAAIYPHVKKLLAALDEEVRNG